MTLRLISVASLILLVFAATAAHAACSNASLSGTYGFVSTGLNGSLLPASSLNQVTADGKGNLTAIVTKSDDGTILNYTTSGTYTVASNCTGKVIWKNQQGNTEHSNIYLNNAGTGGVYQGAVVMQTDANHVQVGAATAQGTATCTNLGVKKAYSVQVTGLDLGTGQMAAAGRLTLNGTGAISGTLTVSIYGVVTSAATVTGSYTINSNCTGTVSITPKALKTMNFNLLVVNADKEILAIETDTNTVVTATFQQ